MLERAVIIPDLDKAYQDDTEKCHKEVAKLKIGTIVRLGKDIPGCDVLLEVAQLLDQEVDLMTRSLLDRKEYALVLVGDQQKIIEGDESSTDPDFVFGILDELGARNKKGLFSHTHWNEQLNPLPSMGGMGFGDIAFWNLFRVTFPNLECRVVANSNGEIKAFRYIGASKD